MDSKREFEVTHIFNCYQRFYVDILGLILQNKCHTQIFKMCKYIQMKTHWRHNMNDILHLVLAGWIQNTEMSLNALLTLSHSDFQVGWMLKHCQCLYKEIHALSPHLTDSLQENKTKKRSGSYMYVDWKIRVQNVKMFISKALFNTLFYLY